MATAAISASPVLDAALGYADRGIPVFPCRADNKRPHLEHGFKDASTDPDQIRSWWRQWPDAMVACPTGPVIGAWVLDVDDPAAFTAAADELGLALPQTRRASTGKGFHLYFRWDDASPVRNSQRTPKGWPFPSLPGAETRGEGGYIILPPSRHPSGRNYAWQSDQTASEPPSELLAIIARTHRQAAASTHPSGGCSAYGLSALEEECSLIRSAPDGAQEAALNAAGLKIGALVAGGEIDLQTAKARLVAAGVSMTSHNPADPWTPEGVGAKIERALQDGTAKPRKAPPLRVIRNPSGPEPTFDAGSDDRPIIEVRAGELHIMATEAEAALVRAGAPIYVRGDGLVRPVVDDMPAVHGRRTKVARLRQVDGNTLVDHLSRSAQFMRFNIRKKGLVPTDPPKDVAATILSRDGEWKLRRLVGVITTPTIRPDGTVLWQQGYDPKTQLLLLNPPTLPRIDDLPTRQAAETALALLKGLLDEFPFVDEASRSVALSALITPVVRGVMAVAPLHAMTAPVAGSGKSYIVDLASALATGDRAPVIAAGQNEEETEKRLGAALLSGQPLISIDNVNGRLGGDALCQLIERPVVSIRVLGMSKLLKIESRATCFATGNNIQLLGDMTRRGLLCSLDPNVERPELRVFQDSPFDRVLANRGAYVAAALTVVRAYLGAGCPGVLPSIASFEDWSRTVRSALVWLGCADPCETMEKARGEDPVITQLRSVLETWHEAVGSSPKTSGSLVEQAQTVNSFGQRISPDLHQALLEVADSGKGEVNSKSLGRYLARYQSRIIAGLKLVRSEDRHAGQALWRVERVS